MLIPSKELLLFYILYIQGNTSIMYYILVLLVSLFQVFSMDTAAPLPKEKTNLTPIYQLIYQLQIRLKDQDKDSQAPSVTSTPSENEISIGSMAVILEALNNLIDKNLSSVDQIKSDMSDLVNNLTTVQMHCNELQVNTPKPAWLEHLELQQRFSTRIFSMVIKRAMHLLTVLENMLQKFATC